MKELRRVSCLVLLGVTTLLLAGAPGASGQTLAMEPVKKNSVDTAITSEVVNPTPDAESEAVQEVITDAALAVVSKTFDVEPGTVEKNIADAAPDVGNSIPDVKSEQAKENIADAASDDATEILGAESSNYNRSQKEKFMFFWANRSTVTKFMLSVFSSVTPYTCAKTRKNELCAGRRRRRLFFKQNNGKLREPELTSIDSSLDTPQIKRSERNGFLTVWTTTFSTKTVTSFYSNTRVTISVSQACTVQGLNFPQCG